MLCGSLLVFLFVFFSSRRRHTRCALVTGVQTCALPIFLRSRACRAPEIRGSSEALRQSPYTFADMPTTRATCVAAFRTVRVRQHGLRGKHLVSCAFSNRTGVVHA